MAKGHNACLLCVPLVARSVPEMLEQMNIARFQGAEILELRLDYLSSFNPEVDLPLLLGERPLPVIITYRPSWEGGQYNGDEVPRLDALRLAVELGADFVDVELKAAFDFFPIIQDRRPEHCKVIVSSHNFEGTPSTDELGALVAKLQQTGTDVVKFATMANKITDVSNIFQILSQCQIPTIGLAMGEAGVISRILSPKFGGFLTFASLERGKESAPGQPALSDLRETYGFHWITRETKVYGIIGKPVSHSKGPIIHNAAFQKMNINAVYVPFLVDDLKTFLNVYHDLDFAGFSVTIPHKEAALECCDEVDPLAKDIGAVNTVIKRSTDGKLIGYNTDCEGAITAIEDGLRGKEQTPPGSSPLAGRHFVVIGAGGAGKAIAYGAKHRGAKVFIANRTYERAKALADTVGVEALTLEQLNNFRPVTGMVLANTTSVGMHPNVTETPISKDALQAYSLVFDAVYTPRVTRLLKEAEESGCAVVSGLEMFIRQAILQFSLFTENGPVPEQLMREIMTNHL